MYLKFIISFLNFLILFNGHRTNNYQKKSSINLYVSINGKSKNSGEKNTPFLKISEALKKAEVIKKTDTNSIINIYILPGEYTLSSPITINNSLSGAFKELNIQTRAATLTLRESMANTYDPTDLRLPYNVFENYTLNNGTFADFNFVYIPKFMRAPVPVSDPLFPIPEADGQSGAPTRLMLLSDAYLLLSEAEFMINGSNTASLAAINTVRDRAGLDNLTTLTLKDIQNERSWELAGEAIMGRKTDLIRWGILEDVVLGLPAKERAAGAHANSIERADLQAAAMSAAPSGKYNFLPIPFDEITKSKDLGGALTQNPLWE